MKTSNILLTIFIGSITLYFLAAFTEIRISGKRNSLGLNLESRTILTDDFKYLVSVAAKLDLSFGEEGAMIVRSEKGKESPTPSYHMQGDTLVIDRFDPMQGGYASLHLTLSRRAFRGLNCSGCQLFLANGDADTVEFILPGSDITKNSADTSRFGTLKINASRNAHINLNAIQIDHLDVTLDDCQVALFGPVNSLTGSMVNHAHMMVDEVMDFGFKRDHSSMLNHRK